MCEVRMMPPAVTEPALKRVCTAIAADLPAVVPAFLPAPAVAGLAAEARRRDGAGEFRAARVGRGDSRAERDDIRGDRTLWLDEATATAAEAPLWSALEALRAAVNEATLLGLFSFEGHYAIYPPGAFYRRHRDRFRDDDARVLTCVIYLNDRWTRFDGGALRIYLGGREARDVPPVGGTLVCFPAERYEHEVLPAKRDRFALSGWFLRRA
jgi:SM-20-related protein